MNYPLRTNGQTLDNVHRGRDWLRNLSNGYLWLAVSAIWMLFLFSAWDFRQSTVIGFSFWGLPYGEFLAFNNFSSWLPLSVEVSRGNWFPVDPSLGYGNSGLEFFPYLTLWLHGLLISIFGIVGTQVVGATFLPVCSFIVMVLIFHQYLFWRWSIALASFGITGFQSSAFRDFLFNFLVGEGWTSQAVINPPVVAGFPFPAISLLLFLIVFYLSIRRSYMSFRRATFLSIAWSLQSQIHILNVIFGLPFWFLLLAVNLWRVNHGRWTRVETRQYLVQVFIAFVVCIPMMISFITKDSRVIGWPQLAGHMVGPNSVNWFFLFAYCAMPLGALAIVYRIFRIDPYEIRVKFLPIWVMMGVEIGITIAWEIFNIGITSDMARLRLGLPFLHILYFVPVIYFLCRSSIDYQRGSEGSMVSRHIRLSLSYFFRNGSYVYLSLFLLLLTVHIIASSEKAGNYFASFGQAATEEGQLVFNLLSQDSEAGDVLVGPNPSSNIAVTVNGRYGSLWVNRFSDVHVGIDEAIERFATYGRIIGWTESQFLTFMLPKENPLHLSNQTYDYISSEPIGGLGFFLVFSKKPLNSAMRQDLIVRLRRTYASIDVASMVKKYQIRRIVLRDKPEFSFQVPINQIAGYWVLSDL
jgi:hypothetical protein